MKIEQKIIEELMKSRLKNQTDLNSFKRSISKKYKIPCPSNIQLLKTYHKFLKLKGLKPKKEIESLLKTRPIRSLSGIVNISVLTKPYPCPGKCIFCPIEKGIPKSYLSGEPAVERAKRLKYHPYWQVKKRIEMLKKEGHPTDKIELRIVGGTWSYYPQKYQKWFVSQCFASANITPREKIADLEKEQKRNERAKQRIVGLSIETRPDFINPKEIKKLRELGVTMVELGVQSIYDDILKKNLRGHKVKETIFATKLLKDAGFKVLYQMMLNLPGATLKREEKMFEELFKNPNFQPDYLKIYPCALLKEAPLYRLWKKGKYQPYSKTQLLFLLKAIKKKIPYYVRVQRIVRDIPSQLILKGPTKISNLHQILLEKMKEEKSPCHCIRCREVRERYDPKEKIFLFRQDYEASEGREIFLSFENEKRTKLYSLLRLRIPSFSLKKTSQAVFPVLENSAIIREVQTFGEVVSLGEKKISPQHRGLGKKLIKEAEKIVKKEFGLEKIAVIAGIGAREYFSKLNYKLKETYMSKTL